MNMRSLVIKGLVIISLGLGLVIGVVKVHDLLLNTKPASSMIRHDGSRSGDIVAYTELCTGKKIHVYENEKMPVVNEGNTIYLTNGDIKCFNQRQALGSVQIQDTRIKNNLFTGSIYNKGNLPVFNVNIQVSASTDKKNWNPTIVRNVIIPYPVYPGETIDFAEKLEGVEKYWWTAMALSAEQYNGEIVPTRTTKPKAAYSSKSITDPVVTCEISKSCGGGSKQMTQSQCNNSICCIFDAKCGGARLMTKTQCTNSICCQVGSTWNVYPNHESCDLAQSQNGTANQTTASNPDCSVYYPGMKSYQTYKNVLPSTCIQWQTNATKDYNYTQITISTPIPAPTTDPYLQDLLTRHDQACQATVTEWIQIREQFEQNEFNNYSSSAEAIAALEQKRIDYQNEMLGAGCGEYVDRITL